MEEVYYLARRDIETVAGVPIPSGGFKGMNLEQLLGLPQHFLSRSETGQHPHFKKILHKPVPDKYCMLLCNVAVFSSLLLISYCYLILLKD